LLLTLPVARTAFGIMRRSGFSSEAAQRELSLRRYPQPKKLLQTGSLQLSSTPTLRIGYPAREQEHPSIRGRKLSL
jgi:hypothetical protein